MREKFDFDVYRKSLENEGVYILPNNNTVYMISPSNPDYEKQKEDSIKSGSPAHFWEGDGSGFQYERLPKHLLKPSIKNLVQTVTLSKKNIL